MAKPETMIEYAGRLEREHAAMKAKIDKAVRQLDTLIAELRGQGRPLSEWREDAERIQKGLRS